MDVDPFFATEYSPRTLSPEERELMAEYSRLRAKYGPLTALVSSGLDDNTGTLMDEAFARPNYSSRTRPMEHVGAESRWRNAPRPPGRLIPYKNFEGSVPGLRDPGGSVMAGLHQLTQGAGRQIKDFARNPDEYLRQWAQQFHEDQRNIYIDNEDPQQMVQHVVGMLFPQNPLTMLKVLPSKVPMSRRLPAPKKYSLGGTVAGAGRRLAQRAASAVPEFFAPAPRGALAAVRPTKSQWISGSGYPNAITLALEKRIKPTITGTMPIDQAIPINDFLGRLGKTFEQTLGTPGDPFEEAILRGKVPFTQRVYDDLLERTQDRLDTLGTREAWKKYGVPQTDWGRIGDTALWPAGPSKLADFHTGVRVGPDGNIESVSPGLEQAGLGWMKGKPGDAPIASASLYLPEILSTAMQDLVGSMAKTGIPPKDWAKKPLPSLIDAVHKVITENASKTKLETEAAAKNTADFFRRLPSVSPPDSPFRVSVIDNTMDPEDIRMALSAATDQHQFCVGGGCQHGKGRWKGYVPLLDPGIQKVDPRTGRTVWQPTGPPGETNSYVKSVQSGDSQIVLITDKDGNLRGTLEIANSYGNPPDDLYQAWQDSDVDQLHEFSPYQEWLASQRARWNRVDQIKGKENSSLDDEAAAYVRALLNERGVNPNLVDDLENIKGVEWGKKITSAEEATAMRAASAKALRELIAEQGWPNYDTIKNNKDADWDNYFKWMGTSNIEGGGRTYSPGEIYNMIEAPELHHSAKDFWPHADEIIEYLRQNPQKFEPQAGPAPTAVGQFNPTRPWREMGARRLQEALQEMLLERGAHLPARDWGRYGEYLRRTDIPAGPRSMYSLSELEAIAKDPEAYAESKDVWENLDDIVQYLRQNPRRFE